MGNVWVAIGPRIAGDATCAPVRIGTDRLRIKRGASREFASIPLEGKYVLIIICDLENFWFVYTVLDEREGTPVLTGTNLLTNT